MQTHLVQLGPDRHVRTTRVLRAQAGIQVTTYNCDCKYSSSTQTLIEMMYGSALLHTRSS